MAIAQFLNRALAVSLVCVAIRVIGRPSGTTGAAVEVIGTAALVVWAIDEIARGVNPWRRILGTVVLAVTVIGLTKRLTT